MHYLDANATQPLRPEARAAMLAAWDLTGNPSSVHQAGRTARRVLEDAREALANRFGARPNGLIFTSGGTEADALAVHAIGMDRRLIVSAIEHDAVRAAAPGALRLPVSPAGVADLDVLKVLLADGSPALVCLMLANNETGVIQPIAEAAALCRAYGAVLHVDAVQAVGRMTIDLAGLGAHSLALSSHKLGGPAGIGALVLSADAPFAEPLIVGGGQELRRRGGTQPVALAAGFAAAATIQEDSARLAALRDAAETAAVAAGAVVVAGAVPRLPNTTCLALPGVRADAQVIALDLEGVAVSAGAACSSGKVVTSHVLQAMGLGGLAGEAIRVSLPWDATAADTEAFAAAYQRSAARLRSALAPCPT
ncbi:MAG: cysteine desulfurase family protein [Rhodopila sp.]